MTTTSKILATAAVLALLSAAIPAHAADTQGGMMTNVKTEFAQAIKGIQNWFGKDTPGTPAMGASTDEAMQVPTPVDPSVIEPAAGAYDDDVLQVPPPYVGPDNSGNGSPRASAFDGNQANTAFEDNTPSPEQMSGIAPAAGDATAPDASKMDCKSITDAANKGQDVDTALIEACEAPAQTTSAPTATTNGTSSIPAASTAATVTPVPMQQAKTPAQPALELDDMPTDDSTTAPTTSAPAVTPAPLPETQPSAGQ